MSNCGGRRQRANVTSEGAIAVDARVRGEQMVLAPDFALRRVRAEYR